MIAEFIEPGTSAKDISKRPVITEMLAKMDELRPNFVVFYDLSRSARNDFDAQWLWREITEKRGILIQSTLERSTYRRRPDGLLDHVVGQRQPDPRRRPQGQGSRS